MTDAVRIFQQASAVLLDFDGPVCSVYSDPPAEAVARELAYELEQMGVTNLNPHETDPLRVLADAQERWGREGAKQADRLLTALEERAVTTARKAPGILPVLTGLQVRGVPVSVVTNNSESAVRRWFSKHALPIVPVYGRPFAHPELMKPNSHLLEQALGEIPALLASRAVFVGDSPTDFQAAAAAGVSVIGYAPTPRKQGQLGRLGPCLPSWAPVHCGWAASDVMPGVLDA